MLLTEGTDEIFDEGTLSSTITVLTKVHAPSNFGRSQRREVLIHLMQVDASVFDSDNDIDALHAMDVVSAREMAYAILESTEEM